MDILEAFKAKLENEELVELANHLHHIAMEYPHVELKKKFNVPFYYGKTWLYYLNAIKKGKNINGIEFCFVRGRELLSKELLDFKKRTMIGGFTYTNISEIDEAILKLMIQEAIELDEAKPYTFVKRKKQKN